MKDGATSIIQALPDPQRLLRFAEKLRHWLVTDLNRSDEPVPEFTESRARAMLRAADLLDDPTRHSFDRLLENEAALRLALFDLLDLSGLGESDEVIALAATTAAAGRPADPVELDWPGLAIAAFAWDSGYALYQLDPASPPTAYSPAGQVLKQAAQFVRRQVQRSATERDKLSRELAYAPGDGTPGLDELREEGAIAPLPPYFRSPIPVRYPEVASETIQVDPEAQDENSIVSRGAPITITDADLEDAPSTTPSAGGSREPIRVDPADEIETGPTRVVTPNASVAARSDFSKSVRRKFGRGRGSLKATKLKVVVQAYPDGPGLYGLQVRVRCKGIKSHVAGTTSRSGEFVCELPVPVDTGLTYDVDVTWPRDLGSETERKSVTLNADRTHFTLPFYHRLAADEKA